MGLFDSAALTAIVKHYANAKRFMGNVLIAQGDQIVYEASFGYANLELNVPHSPLTKFRIASVTKPFTAAAIMALEGRGLLRLENPVTAHLPDFPDGDSIARNPHTLAEVIALFNGQPLEFVPGNRFAYCNSNYVLLTAILESITGQSYAISLRELVLEPLGLQDTGVDEPTLVLPNRASGYAWASNAYQHVPYFDMSIPSGDGALYSTARDLQRFARGVCTGALLGVESTARIFSVTASMSSDTDYGLGWGVYRVAGAQAYSHGGTILGFKSDLTYFPDNEVTVVILSNHQGSPLNDLSANLAQAIFEAPVKLPVFPIAIFLPPAALEGLTGRYQLEPDLILEITVQDAILHLFVARQGDFDVYASAPDHFFLDAVDARFNFERDSSGAAVSIAYTQNGITTSAPRLPAQP